MSDNELQRRWAEELADHARSGRMSRRDVLRKAGVFGLSLPLVASVLAACGSDSNSDADNAGNETGDSSANSSDGTTSGSSDASAPSTEATGSGKTGGVLTVGALTPATEVDPITGYDAATIAITQLTHEYLIWLEADLTLRPALAESWTPDDEGATWTVVLRQGVTFSDGTPLDAETVVASYDRLLDPESGSAALSAFDGVLSAGGVSATDASTVVFTLDRPYADFPYLISANTYNALILPKDYAGPYAENAIGTGPFVLDSFSASDGAKFSKNPTYWDTGKPGLDGVEIKFYKDPQAQVLGLQSGEVDTQITSIISLLTPVEQNPDFTIDQVGGTGVNVFTMRVDQEPFTDKNVRLAVATALDRKALNDTLYNGLAELGNDHLLAPAFPASPTDIPQRDIDLDKVTELLAGKDVSFTLTFEPPLNAFAVVLQEQLKQAGITVELNQLTSDEFYAGDQETDTPWLFTQANLVGWAGRAVPTQFIIPMVKSGGVWNGSKYANPELDAAADAYDATTDEDEKKKQARIIAEALHNDVPIIISDWSTTVRPYNSSKWTGIKSHPSSYIDFNGVAPV